MNQPDPAEIEAIAALTPEMNEFVERQRQRIDALPKDFGPIAVHASWLAVVDALLAALATAEERRDQAEFQAEKYATKAAAAEQERDEWRTAAERLADEAFQRHAGSDTPRLTDLCENIFRLGANYHKATGPQAENEEGHENA